MRKSQEENWDKGWHAWCMECETFFLPRKGPMSWGIIGKYFYENDYRRPITVGEHASRSSWLHGLISILQYYEDQLEPYGGYYNTLSEREKRDITLRMRRNSIDPMLNFYLSSHDIGEIHRGDQLADDSDDYKDTYEETLEDEYAVMDDFFHLLPTPLFHSASGLHHMFEELDDSKGGIATYLRAIDKIEEIAFQLFLQTHGVFGNIHQKVKPSERDLYYAELLDTDISADIFTLYYRKDFEHISPEIVKPANKFLEAGFRNVYGYIPECMKVNPSRLKI